MNAKLKFLSNNIPVIYEEVLHVRSAHIKIHFSVGSRHENEKIHGIAHFLEHMLFKGTEKRNSFQIVKEIERDGGSINAYTSKEETVFYINTVDDKLHVAIEVLADMILNSVFNLQDLEQEKKVIHEEIKGAFDAPEDHIWDTFYENLFAPNWSGKSTLGTEESVSAISREQLLDFFVNFYSAENMTIVCVGNINSYKVLEQLEKKFAHIRLGKKENSEFRESFNHFDKSIVRDISQSHILIGKTVPSFIHEDKYSLILINNVLGAGMSSRLFQNIREKYGFAYMVYSSLDLFSDHGSFSVYVATDLIHVEKSTELVKKEVSAILSKKIPLAEFEDIKRQIRGGLLLSIETISRRAEKYLRHYLLEKRFPSLEEQIERYMAISQNDILDAANKHLNPEEFSRIVISSKNA